MHHWYDDPVVEAKVEALIKRLSLAEKIDLVSGKNDIAACPDRAIASPPPYPLLALADGPAGVRMNTPAINDGKATAWPAPIAIAASWDEALARLYGDRLGAEFAATGHNVMLGPAVDIARVPLGGRIFESFGEDPLLQARMVAAEIPAIQAHRVQACIKHYIANNQEFERNTIDVQIDNRTLHEIYLLPFAAAVKAGVCAVMGSYNRVNGIYACGNAWLLTDILRRELGFRGWVISDYLATPDTVMAANAGLDWELGPRHWGDQLLAAVQSGAVSIERLDEMVRRILRPAIGLGLDEHPPQITALPTIEHGELAREMAERCMVLLKNERQTLPLERTQIRSLAVFGPDADSVAAAGGGSGAVQPTYGVSVVEGLRRYLGPTVQIHYAPGVDPIGPGTLLPGLPPIPSCWLQPSGTTIASGLRAAYWPNRVWEGEPHSERVEPNLNFNFGFFDLFPGASPATPGAPARPDGLPAEFSARWDGYLIVPVDGEYRLQLSCYGTARLWLDGEALIDTDAMFGEPAGLTTLYTASVTLRGGSRLRLQVAYQSLPHQHTFGFAEARLRLGWLPPPEVIDPPIRAAAELAQSCDAAIVVARTFEGEQMDRPDLSLPNGQDRLIRAVAAANPRTVVVLMNGGPVATAAWEEHVPAILEAWFAGQEQGRAVARILFGEVNPAGKLPLTFPRDLADTPVATAQQYPGVEGVVSYSEGLLVGYRGYDQLGLTPQYPFGHGLSYTTFAYSKLRIDRSAEDINICFTITNTGQRRGAEVAQVYASLPVALGEPPRRLVGWARVELDPGEQREVTVNLVLHPPASPLSYWDDAQGTWLTASGTYTFWIGASSRDLRLQGYITL
ncbi:beta-glucosidase [Chloroflexus sp.]|uniref:beta-glucosidase n=1 Tax=Chloroflexus sp. TaxID=1904827 RepID=UPI00298F292C|nr:glycoside hydrolase family 3 C-terminal domain-containing protein [Chloroflexus sp.]MDW8404161.1 glycoside hydrolase family 3 C-terminal domain-containing protein [Chloroflexus sp.]